MMGPPTTAPGVAHDGVARLVVPQPDDWVALVEMMEAEDERSGSLRTPSTGSSLPRRITGRGMQPSWISAALTSIARRSCLIWR